MATVYRGTNWRIELSNVSPSKPWEARWGGINPPSGLQEDLVYFATLDEAASWVIKKGAPALEVSTVLNEVFTLITK